MECFGDDDDDDDVDETKAMVQRDQSCGVCCFHLNTEASLLAAVRNSMTSVVTDSPSRDVLSAIDEFCLSRHWMMHVGPEKGDILIEALRSSMLEKIHLNSKLTSGLDSIPFIAVELGTCCGYSSILMGRTMREISISGNNRIDCHLITTEINEEYVNIASEMILLSQMQDLISVHEISYNGHDTDIVATVSDAIMRLSNSLKKAGKIDFLFIDHDKNAYASDLRKLERSGMIRHGTKVVADNVIFAKIDDYMEYVKQRAEMGIVKTITIPCHVEYSVDRDESGESLQHFEDGVEITNYLQDP
jgi:catechol O-methyltransferase